MTADQARVAAGAPGGGRGLPNWLKVIGSLTLGVTLAIVAWLMLSGEAVVGDAHKRNFHDLEVAAHGLETWPDALRTLARAQFIAGNVKPASGRQQDDGWTYRVEVIHPTIGKYQILYTVRADQAACASLRDTIERRERMRLPFIASNRSGEGPQVKIIDSMPIRDLYRADHAAGVALPGGTIGIDRISADGGSGAATTWPTSAYLCYASVVPIERLLALRSSRTQFVNFLIGDSDRRVVRQLGAQQLPIDSIDQLVPKDSALSVALTTAVPGSRATMQATKPARLTEALDPVSLTLAGRSYVGYVRPFHLPPGVPGCETMAATAPRSEVAPPQTCFLVGLVPRDVLRRSAFAIAPLPGTSFLLIFILLLVLVPTLQLLLIGPGEAVPRLTAILAVAGMVFAVGVATIAVTFAADVVREREGARREGQAIAARMAARVAHDVKQALGAATRIERSHRALLLGTQPTLRDIEPRPFDARRDPGQPAAFDARLFGTLTYIGSDGRNLACGARTLRLSEAAGSRTDVSGRSYFMRANAQVYDGVVPGSPSSNYTIDQVRAQTDGINKTILAMDVPPDVRARASACTPAILLATTILPDLVAPVLPSPFSFMVVDGRAADVSLPVIFHSEEQRAGAETLTTAFDDRGTARLRQWWSTRGIASGTGVGTFETRYDGATRQYSAAAIEGTPWILLVGHSYDKVDRLAARTALLALGNWISWFAAAPLIYWLARRLYLLSRGRSFNMGRDIARMWPRELRGRPYRRLAARLGVAAAVAAVSVIVFSCLASPLAVVVAAAAATGVSIAVFVASKSAEASVGALRPDTERDYRRMLGAAALSIAVIPALALWSDARSYVLAQHDGQVLAGLINPGGAIARWQTGIGQLARSAAVTVPALENCGTSAGCFAGIAARPVKQREIVETDVGGLAGTLTRWIGRPSPTIRTCIIATPGYTSLRTMCTDDSGAVRRIGISAHAAPLPALTEGGWIGLLVVVAIAGALAIALWQLLQRVLVALAGFGIPLEAVTRPSLYVGDRASAPPLDVATPLPDRTLIVGAPLVLREHFIGRRDGEVARRSAYTQIDLAAPGSLRLGPDDTRIVAFGLQLVLNDADRRREALQRLEACDRHVRAVRGRQMVIMSSLSPLERIIDAYERDRDDQIDDQSLLKYREQLRWSLLLERYATFTFRAVDNYDPNRRRGRARALLARLDEYLSTVESPHERHQQMRIVETMLSEIRWLPAHVIESAVGVDITGAIARVAARRRSFAHIFPLNDIYYQWVIVPIVIDWALRLKPASRQATVDYLRGTIIEHYQQCWSASTVAERVVLDHLAHDRFVNVARACIPLTALVRRGLVVFDPTPRLMNHSFRMFVRQAERPERIREWRALQPVGSWARARLPLLIGLPAIAIAMLVEAIWSGVDPAVVLPLFLAGLPALMSQVAQVLRLSPR